MYKKSSHTVHDLKYHLVWCTKYRYRVLTGEVANRVRELIREVCVANYVEIVSGSLSPDYVHILVSVPPNFGVDQTKVTLFPQQILTNLQKWAVKSVNILIF